MIPQQDILVLNCGSSSIKFAVIDAKTQQKLLTGLVERIASSKARCIIQQPDSSTKEHSLTNATYTKALDFIFTLLKDVYNLQQHIIAVGHRVVHGGEKFTQATLINHKVLAAIKDCAHLAPLHNPANILGIEAVSSKLPKLAQVAVFDTAFHQTMPPHAYIYPIPYALYKKYGVRRYGFHGTSHKYVTQKAAELLSKPYHECAWLSAHLGNGCSAAAVLNGQSVDTTMGLTPLEGLMMGTRSGDVDPGLHEYLANNLKLDIHQITAMLNQQSGLLGVSVNYSDMRSIEKAAQEGETKAALALNIFCYRLAKQLSALTVALKGRLDALIFTGGIGENSSFVRSKTLALLTMLGFALDEKNNLNHGRENGGLITQPTSRPALVIATNEELMIANETLAIIKQ